MADEPFRFLDLPAELRHMVYNCLSEKFIVEDDEPRDFVWLTVKLPGVAILATCRQINEEAGAIINKRLDAICYGHDDEELELESE
jgi:hypothetical protein